MRRPFLLTLVIALLALTATSAHATTSYQPDLVFGSAGDDIYGPDPAQHASQGVSPAFGIAYQFEAQNDGTQTDTLRLRLRGSGDPDIWARVTVGTTDVTSEFSPGPYRVRDLAPGGAATFGFGLAATTAATPGDTHTFRLVARSAGDPTARDVWVFDVTVLAQPP